MKRYLFLLVMGLALALTASLVMTTLEVGAPSRAARPSVDMRDEVPFHSPTGVAVGGVITQSTTWSLAHSPYTLVADVVVTAGVTLTIDPGVRVKGNHGTQLQVRGHLEAVGSLPITFTSSADDGPGGWEGLNFDGGTGHLELVTVRYAGQDNGLACSSITIQNVTDGEVRILDSQVVSNARSSFKDYGLYASNSAVVIQGTTFAHNGDNEFDVPVQIDAGDLYRTQMAGNTFVDNSRNLVSIAGGAMGGSASLAPQAGLDAYLLSGNLVVPAGVTLILEPDVVMMGNSGVQVEVQGHLSAVGSATQPIHFTSATESGFSGWEGIYFNAGTGHLQHAIVRYAGQENGFSYSSIAVRDVLAGEVRIENCQILSSSHTAYTDYGLDVSNSRVVLHDTLLAYLGNSGSDVPLRIEATDLFRVDMQDNVFRDNNLDRILVAAGTMGGSASLAPQTGLEAYQLSGDIVVPAGVTLTVEPGMIVLGNNSAHLEVAGHLDAIGNPAQPILFTSATDDDSSRWEGLYFHSGTGHLRFATVRYAGQSDGLVRSGITVQDVTVGQVLLESSQIISNSQNSFADYGLYVSNGRVRLVSTDVTYNGNNTADHGLYATDGSTIWMARGYVQNNVGTGLTLIDSHAALTCTTVAGNGRYGLRLLGSSATISSTTSFIYENVLTGLENLSGTAVDARNNWWGDPSGPYHPTLNPAGLGEEVSDDVLFVPWNQEPICTLKSFVYLPTVER